MKKLIDLLRENLEEKTMEVKEVITKDYDVVDEVGKFFVVIKPDTKSTKEIMERIYKNYFYGFII